MKKHWLQALRILIPCLLFGCSTLETKVDQGLPKPLWTFTKQDRDALILKQWAPTKKEIFKTSTFSEAEIIGILSSFALDRAMADHFDYKSEALGDCLTINLLEIKVVDPSKVDGSTNEIWEVDLCSLRASFPISLTAEKRNWIKANPAANTRPNGFPDRLK